jgi:hypothetical protein
MNQTDLKNIFNRFVGQEVPLIETTNDGGKGAVITLLPANYPDPVLKEMYEEAQKNGLDLRVMWPGLMTTMDWRADRVTTNIVKGADKKWRISPDFHIG